MNFVTVLDHKFLPQLLALHASLERHCASFALFVVCVDQLLADQLGRLALPMIDLINIETIQDAVLAEAKRSRTAREFCWTLSSQSFRLVHERHPEIRQLTYVDADLYFFAPPERLTGEMTKAGKHVLITEHAYGPEYQHYVEAGRFCVQFLTVDLTSAAARAIIDEWQKQCLDWCYDRVEDGKFGDQLYLEEWPERYGQTVHIVEEKAKTLAPWNVDYYMANHPGLLPVFFHFHSLRLISPRLVQLYWGYKLSRKNLWVYRDYCRTLARVCSVLRHAEIAVPCFPELRPDPLRLIKRQFVPSYVRYMWLRCTRQRPHAVGT